MTNTVTYTTTEISLAKLIPSPANVRRTGARVGIEALAASIQAHGLLQSLVVRPKLDGAGQATDRYEVVAGARRLVVKSLPNLTPFSRPRVTPLRCACLAVLALMGRSTVTLAAASFNPFRTPGVGR